MSSPRVRKIADRIKVIVAEMLERRIKDPRLGFVTVTDVPDVPGAFVLGSNDYFEPTLRNPVRYLLPDDGRRHISSDPLPWRDLRDAFDRAGWLDLTNAAGSLEVDGRRIAFAGVDDSHLKRDRYDLVAGPADRAQGIRRGQRHSGGRRPSHLRLRHSFASRDAS